MFAALPFANAPIATQHIALPFSATSAIATLPFVSEIQYLIYECVYGTPAYRTHRAKLMRALGEMKRRLSFKLALEQKASDLSGLLMCMRTLGWVEDFSVRQIDLSAVQPGFIRVFPSYYTSMIYSITWSALNLGPSTICVSRNNAGQLSFMTPDFFRPTHEELSQMRRPRKTVIREHTTIGEFVEAILPLIQSKLV